MLSRWILAIAVLFAMVADAAAGGHSHGTTQPAVAVIFTAEVNLESSEADALGDRIARAIEQTFTARGLPTSQIRRLGIVIEPTCASSPECASDLGKQIGANFLLFVSAVKLGGELNLDPVWTCADCGSFALRSRVVLPASASASDLKKAVLQIVPIGDLARRSPPKPARRATSGVWIAGGAALALGAVAGGVGAWSLSRADDCEEAPGCTDSQEQQVEDDVKTRNLIADLFLTASIAAVVTGGVLYYLSDRQEPSSDLQVGVTAGGGGQVGLSLTGQF